jgi:hypothetical protein
MTGRSGGRNVDTAGGCGEARIDSLRSGAVVKVRRIARNQRTVTTGGQGLVDGAMAHLPGSEGQPAFALSAKYRR